MSVHAAAAAHGVVAQAAGIHVPQIRYLSILPVIVMLGGAVLLLGAASLVRKQLRLRIATVSTVIIASSAFGFAW